MKNTTSCMNIDGHNTVVKYADDIGMFRGYFVGLAGGADFYGQDVDTLKKEGKASLDLYLETCAENQIDPLKNFSGKFNIRMETEQHRQAANLAEIFEQSLNQFVVTAVEKHCRDATAQACYRWSPVVPRGSVNFSAQEKVELPPNKPLESVKLNIELTEAACG